VGKSTAGRELWVLEVGAPEAPRERRDEEGSSRRPAVLVLGGLTGGDPASGEVALRLAADLLARDGRDARVAGLLATRAFYFCPRPNPDAVETLFTSSPRLQPGTAAPFDDDGDGRVDEDGPEDLDGDGVIAAMRLKDGRGEWRAAEGDPRRLERVKPGEVGEWRLFPAEGIDNDGDGEVNEDATGGTRLDRNFPAGWRLHAERPGAGPYPVSEPETRALVEYFLAHPEIAAVVVLRDSDRRSFAPRATRGELPRADRDLFDRLSESYEETRERGGETARERPEEAGREAERRPVPPRRGGAAPSRRPAAPDATLSPTSTEAADTFLDWAYGQMGALAISPEVWSAPPRVDGTREPRTPEKATDPQGEGERQERRTGEREGGEAAWFTWNDRALGGKGFVSWRPFDHPTLGKVEIGGWRPFTRHTPPASELPALARAQSDPLLAVAERTPLLLIAAAEARALGAAGEGRRAFRVTVTLRNAGDAPTVLAAGSSAPGYVPVFVSLEGAKGARLTFLHGTPRLRVGTLAAREERTLEWVVAAPPGTDLSLRAESSRAGGERRAIRLTE
jgi:hypothetical protein